MLSQLKSLVGAVAWMPLVIASAGCAASPADESVGAQGQRLQVAGQSELVTWTCAGSPCPWGSESVGHALVWPTAAGALNHRLGYNVSAGIYLPAAAANGVTVTVATGVAALYAGMPDADAHRFLDVVGPGQPYQISGLAAGEVVSVQSGDTFTYDTSIGSTHPDPGPTPPPPPPPPPPSDPGSGTPPAGGGSGTPSGATASSAATWSCTGSPCPWGPSDSAQAVAWPASAHPVTQRLGYTVSPGIYLPAVNANGVTVSLATGTATAYAGLPTAPNHRALGTISPGQPFQITGLAAGEVASVQSPFAFTFDTTAPGTADVPADPVPPPTPPVTGPTNPGDVINSVKAFWRCEGHPNCDGGVWVGAVINWPSWAAYTNNNRPIQSKWTFDEQGNPLYPYMGSWANGCKVTNRGGAVLIIEWQRGTDVWRETWLDVGQSHVITLTAPEDGAMIETYDFSPGFSVSLENCTPKPLP